MKNQSSTTPALKGGKKKKTWGGAREGAGRPASERPKRYFSYYLEEDLGERLAQEESPAGYLNKLLRKHFKIK